MYYFFLPRIPTPHIEWLYGLYISEWITALPPGNRFTPVNDGRT